MSEPRDYEVGYGRPPKATRFKKGQSGNPKGRPKGALNAATLMRQIASETITAVENGRERRMSLLEVLLRQLARKGAKGDLKSTELVLRLFGSSAGEGGESDEDEDGDAVEVQRALLGLQAELLRGGQMGGVVECR